jgi:diguanylate cyclase (GGDEF)-like protein
LQLFRNFSIKTRILVSLILVTGFPVIVYLYVQYTGIVISNTTALVIGLLALINALIVGFLVAVSISSPVQLILHSLQVFQTKKSAATINDNGFDEIAEVATELNRIYSEWNREIVQLSKKQLHQEKHTEKTEQQISNFQKQLDLTRSCLKVAQNLNTTFDFQSNLKAILDEAIGTINVQWASILLVNRETNELTVVCVRGVEKSLLDALADEDYPSIKLKPHEGLAGQVIKEGLPLIANKGHKDPRFKQFSEFSARDARIASLLCAPISSQDGTILGVMNFINRVSPPVFRNEDLPYVKDLCGLAALVIERNRLYRNLFEDEETGLSAYNVWKGYFLEEATRSVRYVQPLTVLIADIDEFKSIADQSNASFAHEIADTCGKELKQLLRDTDTASCVQERFFVLLPNTDSSGGVYLAGRLKEALEKLVFKYDNKEFKITMSAGIASYPDNVADPKLLSRKAILTLNQAHDQGGNRAVIYKSN